MSLLGNYSLFLVVPPTWTKDDLNFNIEELENLIKNQTSYIQLQEEKIQRNDE